MTPKPLSGVSGERVRVDLGETDLSSDRTAEDGFSDFVVDHERSLRQAYWQRPVGGSGAFFYGETVGRPTMIIAYDADGDEIGRWPA